MPVDIETNVHLQKVVDELQKEHNASLTTKYLPRIQTNISNLVACKSEVDSVLRLIWN
jgi:hypothetical protein